MGITLNGPGGSKQTVGYVKRSGGGYEKGIISTTTPTGTGGTFTVTKAGSISNKSLARGQIDQANIEAFNANKAVQSVTKIPIDTSTKTSSQAVASTVGPGGIPSVIKQSDSQGGFSSVYNGGPGYGVMPYSSQSVVPIAGAKVITSKNKSYGGTVIASNNIPSKPKVLLSAFTGGFKTFPAEGVVTGKSAPSSSSVYTANSAEASLYDLGKATSVIAEPLTFAYGAGPAFRAQGALVGAARATKVGSLPVIKTVLGPGTAGFAVRGFGEVVAISSAARAIENKKIAEIGVKASIPDLSSSVQKGVSSYKTENTGIRNLAEGTTFLFTNRKRFEKSISEELISSGVKPSQAYETASDVFENRAKIRVRSDVLSGIGAEKASESFGRRLSYVSENRLLKSFSPKASVVGSRVIGSSGGGVVEGSLQSISSDIQDTGKINLKNTARGAAFGGVFAGAAGGYLAKLRYVGSNRKANIVEGSLDIIDPLERPGDLAADAFESGYRSGAARGGYPRVYAPSAFSASSNSADSPSRASVVPVRVNLNVPIRVPARVPSLVPVNVASRVNLNVPTNVPTRVPSVVPTRVPTRINLNVPTNVPTRVPVVVPVNVPTNVPTRVPTPPLFIPPFFPPGGGGGGGGFGLNGPRRGQRKSYIASFSAKAFNIGGGSAKRTTGFTGLETRGLLSAPKKSFGKAFSTGRGANLNKGFIKSKRFKL